MPVCSLSSAGGGACELARERGEGDLSVVSEAAHDLGCWEDVGDGAARLANEHRYPIQVVFERRRHETDGVARPLLYRAIAQPTVPMTVPSPGRCPGGGCPTAIHSWYVKLHRVRCGAPGHQASNRSQ